MTDLAAGRIGAATGEQRRSPIGRMSTAALAGLRSTPPAVIGIAVALLSVYPLLKVVGRLFWVDGTLTADPVRETISSEGIGGVLLDTVVIVGVSTAIAMVIGGTMAWLNERTDARVGVLTDALPLVNFILPSVAGAIGWVFLLSPRAGYMNGVLRWVLSGIGIELDEGPFTIFSWYGIVLAYAANLVPFAFIVISAGLRQLDGTFEEQSRVSGAGWAKTVRRVTLPAVRPSIGAAALLMMWAGLGMFSVPAILASGTDFEVLSVRIVRSLTFGYPPETGVAVGLGVMAMVAMSAVWFVQRRVLRLQRFGTVGGKHRQAQRIQLGRWRWVARLFMLLYLLGAVVLPIVALLLVSLNGFWTLDVDWGNLNLTAFRRAIVDDPVTWRALSNSLKLGAVVATVVILAAAIISEWVLRRRSTMTKVVDGAIKFPATMPSVIIATGFLLTFNGSPFNLGGTLTLLVLAYFILSMPEASVISDAAAGQVGNELVEASSISGSSRSKTFRRINLPLMISGLVAGWALVFVRTVGDVNASAILATSRNTVVGYRILEIYDNGSYAQLGMLAMTLTLVSVVVIIVMMTLSRVLSRWQHPRPQRAARRR